MIIGVTGAKGYLGAALVQLLLARGHEVIAFSRTALASTNARLKFVRFELGSIVEDAEFRGLDAVIHCAFDFRNVGSPEFQHRNVKGTLDFFAQAKQNGVTRLLFVSSMAAYAGCRSDYGRAKVAVESKLGDLGGVSVRPGTIWSARGGGFFAALERLVAVTPVIPSIGGRSLMLHLVHIDDLCGAIAGIVEHGWGDAKEPTLLANPQPVSLRAVLEAIAHGKHLSRVFIPVPAYMAYGGLRALERIGVRIGLRSDSLVSLMWPDPTPSFNSDFPLRPFPEHSTSIRN